jgi:hypothetical protein
MCMKSACSADVDSCGQCCSEDTEKCDVSDYLEFIFQILKPGFATEQGSKISTIGETQLTVLA